MRRATSWRFSGRFLKRDWTSALHFTIFDEDLHFKGRRGAALEPRETVVADLTGDGKEDFAFLIHDRVLLYYQD